MQRSSGKSEAGATAGNAAGRSGEREKSEPSRRERHAVMKERLPRANAWTPGKRARFIEALAATCNVQAACRAVGMSDSGVYALRRRDAGFRRQWRAAIAEGYARLELEMLERALIAEETMRGALGLAEDEKEKLSLLGRYPQRVAELLYKAHRQTALEEDGAADDDPDGEKALALIRERIERVRERLDKEERR